MTLAEAFHQVNFSSDARSELIKSIFSNSNLKNVIKQYIISHGGDSDIANIVFNDMIVQFVKTAFGPKANDHIDGDLEPYLVGIAKHLWFAELKRKNKHAELVENISDQLPLDPSPEELFITNERRHFLATLLENLRSNCKAVLMHWANGFSMQEIAEKLNYLSEGMARKKKSQCMSELNDYLMSNPHIKNTLLS